MNEKAKTDLTIWDEHRVKGDHLVYGRKVQDGTIMSRIETAEYNNCYYQFKALIIWQLYMKMAKDFEERSKKLSQLFQREQLPQKVAKRKVYTLRTPNLNDALEYFESIISTYLFAFTTLEAYVNSRIDNFTPFVVDFINLETLTKKTIAGLIKTKNDLIKECSLYDKIFIIIPYFLHKKNIDTKKIKSFRKDFEKIQFIRNELVHLKRLKIRTSSKDGKFVTQVFWNTLIPCFKNQDDIQLNYYPATFVSDLIQYIDETLNHTK
jgi:hypothetical protein